jgi:hypothetical protein
LFGGGIFWALTALAAVFVIASIDGERPVYATGVITLYLAALTLFSTTNVFLWAYHNPLLIAYGIGGYILAGVIWSVVKWYFFVLNKADQYQKFRNGFMQELKIKEIITPEQKAAMRNYLRSHHYDGSFPPKASENYKRIIMWMTYWPFSGVWTLINDPVKRAFKFCYLHLAGAMQAISNSVFKKYSELED